MTRIAAGDNMKNTLALLFAVLALATFACSSNTPAAPAPAPKPALSATPAAAAPAATSSAAKADIKDFKHQDLTVKVGTTVTWTNQDNVRHTTSSTAGKWKSEPLTNGETFSFTFKEAGTFEYQCDIHNTMKAKVTVN
jgi:plastocyanin